jgi:superfamily II DNA/RNA helicase
LHGDVPQFKRENAYRKFKEGRLKILVATNVAARGLDFPDIDLVIQTEPPNNTEPYIHRSGRTARKGKEGSCVTLFTQNTERHIRNIER